MAIFNLGVIRERIKKEYERLGLSFKKSTKESAGTWDIYLDGIEQILQGLSGEEKQKLNDETLIKLLLGSVLIGDKFKETSEGLKKECEEKGISFTNEDWEACRDAIDYWIKESSLSIEKIQEIKSEFWIKYSLRYFLVGNKLKVVKKKLKKKCEKEGFPFTDKAWQACLEKIKEMSAEEIQDLDDEVLAQRLLEHLSPDDES